MACRRGFSCGALTLVLGLGLSGVAAARPPDAHSGAGTRGATTLKPGSPAAVKLARTHFKRALDRYRKGAYREAIDELDKAAVLDPTGKDLVYNRGLVYEKLGQIDDAVHAFERYLKMVHDSREQKRVRAIIRRLKGARQEVEAPQKEVKALLEEVDASRQEQPSSAAAVPGHAVQETTGHGRLDGWVIATSGVAAAAVLLGTVFGVRALAVEPGSGASTGPGRSYAEVQSDQQSAHSSAVIADVSFVVGILSGAAAGGLYFLRAPAPVRVDVARSMPALPRRSASGFSFTLGARF